MTVTVSYAFTNVTTVFRGNNSTPGTQNFPDVAVQGGNFAIGYGSNALGSTEWYPLVDMYSEATGYAYTRTAGPVGSFNETDMIGGIAVAALTNGTMVFAYDRGQAITNNPDDIRGRRFDFSGSNLGNEVSLSTFTTDTDPDLAGLTGGGLALVVEGGTDLWVKTFSANLSSASGFELGESLSGTSSDPQIAALTDGGFVVTFTNVDAARNGGNPRIYASIFNADGTARQRDILVGDFGINTNATVTGMPNGNWAVAYVDTGWTNGVVATTGISLAIFDASGGVVNGLARVDSSANFNIEVNPSIAALSNSMLVVTWSENTANADIWGRFFTSTGALLTVGGVTSVQSIWPGAGVQDFPSTAALPNGRFVTAFTDSQIEAGGNPGIGALVQQLTRVSTGDGANDTMMGDAIRDSMDGGGGNDTLDGGVGGDVMRGGPGDDNYVVDTIYDEIEELPGEGRDTVFTSFTITLPDNFEDIAISGATGAVNITGNAAANLMVGDGSVNTLDGLGGTDTLVGGGGNDLYVVDSASDIIIEGVGGGRDTVYTALTYYQLGDNVDDIAATGGGLYMLGNALNNLMVGGNGADTFIGNASADTLIGGLGDDFYIIGDLDDVIIESSGQGRDTINTAITYYQMGDNVEDLAVNGGSGTYAIGNSVANLMVGAGNADTLDGRGGADQMVGGLGNDIYFVDDTGDATIESAGQGRDTVYASINWTLGDNMEDLALTGTGNINGRGNGLVNLLVGNDGNNRLTGFAGNDVLVGGAGADEFNYTATSEGGDAITDFVAGADKIRVNAAAFGGGLVAGGGVTLVANANPSSVGAAFLYDTDDGRLFWDADGAGGAAPILIATLQSVPGLSASDFLVF